MPLPANGAPWPPPEFVDVYARMSEYDAWYSGDPARLYDTYSLGGTQLPRNRPSQYSGGLRGIIARFFWGEPIPQGERPNRLHVPLPADIATGSADLLFSEPPKFKFEDSSTQDRWDTLADDLNLDAKMSEAAEVCAPLGGVYLRAGYDKELAQHPLLTPVHADRALPEFSYGILRAVTFWTQVHVDGTEYLRHVERHELNNGMAVVLHGLYRGTINQIGTQIKLADSPATSGLQPVVTTNIPGLLISYIPNMLPSRLDRGCQQGRSDYEGVEPMFDALDETVTSWMRDIRLAKGRAFVPSAWLESNGPGRGATFDVEREIYESLNIPPTGDVGITLQQFEIRVAEHRESADYWTRRAVGTAGYSPETFGLKGEDTPEQTATEVNAKGRKSMVTRAKKINYMTAGLRATAFSLLALDANEFASDITPERPTMAWPDGVSEDQLKLAQTLAALRAAEAASTWTLVSRANPDWDDTKIREEVNRIRDDQQSAFGPDPENMLRNVAANGTTGEPPNDEGQPRE